MRALRRRSGLTLAERRRRPVGGLDGWILAKIENGRSRLARTRCRLAAALHVP
jgi:hypothetical protein